MPRLWFQILVPSLTGIEPNLPVALSITRVTIIPASWRVAEKPVEFARIKHLAGVLASGCGGCAVQTPSEERRSLLFQGYQPAWVPALTEESYLITVTLRL